MPLGWPRIHGADELKAGGELQRPGGPGHGDGALLQGLAHGLQHVPAELRQLIQEEDAVVGEADLPGAHERPAARESGDGGAVVRGAEGAAGQEGVAAVQLSGDGPDGAALQGLRAGELRQDGGQAPGQHGLARTGRADEEHVVPSGGGDLQGPLGVLLAHDIPEVRQGGEVLRLRLPGRGGREGRLAPEMGEKLRDILRPVDREALGQGGLGGVLRRDVEGADAGCPGGQGHGQDAGDAPEGAGEGEFAQEGRVLRQGWQVTVRRQDAEKDGQVIDRAGLLGARRGQVHGDAAHGELGPAVFHGGPDPLPGLPDGGVRQAHDVKGREPAGEEALRKDRVALQSGESQGTHRNDHT